MKHYLKHLDAAVRAVEIDSPTSYSWFGKLSPPLPPHIEQAISPELAREHLIFTLQNQLYTDFYGAGFATPSPSESEDLVAGGMRLAEKLSAANCSRECWEPGWEVRALENETVVVSRKGLELWVRSQDCRARDGATFLPGVEVSLRVTKESFGVSPGYYVALSDVPLSWDGTQILVRLYWNVRSETAARLVQSATSRFNGVRLPFRLKVLSESGHYRRCDAGVLYILKSDYDVAAPLLAAIHADIEDGLNPGTPMFTKWLAPGVGLAEEPGQEGASFGQHRCRLLAEGMVRAYEGGETSPEARLDVVINRFGEAGIDLEHPYLNPGSRDDYHSQLRQGPAPRARSAPARAEHAAEQFLTTAAAIGQRLSREAVWDRGRCNWLGMLLRPYGGKISLAYTAMGPDVYDGTSGIALFLAELYTHTGEQNVRHAALGAIRQAISASEKSDSVNSLGLYNGTLSVALAAARVGTVLGEDELVARAGWLLDRTLRERPQDREYDLLSGRAGGIAALIVLHDALENPGALELASQLGDELLALADETDGGYSWRSVERPTHRNLTGLSHGTAGVGYALLELYQATGEQRYRTGGQLAFQYERSWFSLEAANWPDFRDEPARALGKRQNLPLKFLTQWCHGAPGIALTRLRAYELLGDDTIRDEALVGLESTYEHTAAALANRSMSYSLCHGLCSNAEVLLDGGRTIGWERLRGRRLAHDIAQEGVEIYGAGRRPWPCGLPIPSAETPGLFLGLAGIGYYYLRLHDPTIPSVLLPRREEFVGRWVHGRRQHSYTGVRTGSNAVGAGA